MALELRRCDPNDRARPVPHSKRPADSGGTLPETTGPQSIADDRGASVVRRGLRKLVILIGEEASHLWCDAEHGEVAAGNAAGAQVNGRWFVVESDFQIRRVADGKHARK